MDNQFGADTSVSFLDSLRNTSDARAWERLVELYTPLIRGWLRRHAMLGADADDVVQEVLSVVFRKLPEFHRGPRPGSFRSWLRLITVNCLRSFWRTVGSHQAAAGGGKIQSLLEQLEDPDSGLSHLWDQEHDRHVSRRLMEQIQPDFEERTWQAFQRLVLDEAPVEQVATELGISQNAVFIAKSRVLARLRQVGHGLLD